ncbi:MAG: spermidine/putrescine ABC transporter substrate-binding protein [Deltaproteobacteria bacterium]|jgi:spermidine/putrescine transport system substrate-binding protein|nr:spermidine/putrescine ABC transporter substrate-binding protein [Deltaproteobacteria bacterium]
MKPIKIFTLVIVVIGLAALAIFRPWSPDVPAPPESGTPVAPSPPAKQLNIFIWSEYIDPDVIVDFEKTHNVKVRLDLYETNEEMIHMLQTGRPGAYDIIVPTTYFIPTLVNLKLIQPLNKNLIPNMVNIDPMFLVIEEDPGNQYVIPYQWGTSGLVIRSKDPASVKASWDQVFDFSPSQGTFILFDTARDVLGSALKYLGYSSNTINQAELEKAGQLITEAKNQPNFMGFSGGVDGLSKVVGEVATVSQVYNGEAVKAAMEDPELVYVAPEEGCEIWLDLFAIPTGADNVAVAHEFLNYVLEPEVAAKLSDYSKYASPNIKARDLIPQSDRDNPAIYPPQELIDKMEYYKDLGPNSQLYEEMWTIVKSK